MKKQKYLDEMRLIAEKNGGKLLDSEWKGSHIKYRFLFSNGEQFEIAQTNLKARGWPKNTSTFSKNSRIESQKQQSSRYISSLKIDIKN